MRILTLRPQPRRRSDFKPGNRVPGISPSIHLYQSTPTICEPLNTRLACIITTVAYPNPLELKMIRTFEPRDMDRLLEIWLSASIKAHDFIDASFWQANIESMRDVYIPASETFVIEDSSGVLGFYSLLDNQLAALFVDPAHQGNGFGKQLLDHAKCLRNELSLAVYKENTPSVGFYTSQGFKRVKEQIDEQTGHAEFLMCYPG